MLDKGQPAMNINSERLQNMPQNELWPRARIRTYSQQQNVQASFRNKT